MRRFAVLGLAGGLALMLADTKYGTQMFCAESKDCTIEPSTGVEFANTVQLQSGDTLNVLAVTVRKIFVFFTTYSVGFYMNEKSIRDQIQKIDSDEPQAIRDILLQTDNLKMIRIVTARETSGNHLRDGMATAILKFVEDKACSREQNEELLLKFKSLFPKQFAKDAQLDFVLEGDVIQILVDDEFIGQLENATDISRALASVYIAKDGKVPDIGNQVLKRLTDF